MNILWTTWVWNPMSLILLGGIISLIGTFWATRQQLATERESRIRAEETLAYLQGDHSLKITERFETDSNGKELLVIFVKNVSKLPTYSLTAREIDVGAYGFESIQSMQDMLKNPSPIYSKELPNLAANDLAQILSLKLNGNKQEHIFKIFLTSLRGNSEFRIKYRKTQSRWTKETLHNGITNIVQLISPPDEITKR